MRAVIYCRVSTVEQTQNLSLPTQEKACREYCERQGYAIDEVFIDAGESAKTIDRPEFRRLLEHCRRGRGRLHAVVVYSLTRFSRNSADHHAISGLLKGLGIALRSVTEPIDDSPSGRLMEGILAAMAQFDNDVRSERVTAGMKAAVDRGRWVWPAPIGYQNANNRGRGGPSLIPDPTRAPAVREAFELYAAGIRGRVLLDRVRDLGLRTTHEKPISFSRLYEILRQPVYVGLVRSAALQKDVRGDFEALVSDETFGRVQLALSRAAAPPPQPTRRDPGDEDFPLRKFVRCASCGRALTGSWSRGRNGSRYPFYHCTRGCVRESKHQLESTFVELLDTLRPQPAFWKLFKVAILDAWREETRESRNAVAAARLRVAGLEQKLERLEDAFVFQQSIDKASYQARRDKLREDIALETVRANEASIDTMDVEGLLAFAEHTIDHAGALWTNGTPQVRMQLQWTMFPTGVRLDAKRKIEPPFSCWEFYQLPSPKGADCGVVDLGPPTWNRIVPWLRQIYQLKAAA